MARKACFENFHEKGSGTLIVDNVSKGYDFLYDLICGFKKALTSLTIASLTSSSITSVRRLLMWMLL